MLLEMDFLFYYSSYDSKKKNEFRKHFISISGSDGLERWMRVVGIKNNVKLSRYFIWKKYGFCPSKTTFKERKDILNGKLDLFSVGL
jgi:hypothetical protein